MLSDLRHSLRTIARAKSTSAVLLLSLGLGTGANAAVYGVLDALLLRGPAGLDRPSELVSLFTTDNTGAGIGPSSYPDYLSVQAGAPAFTAMAAIDDTTVENMRIGESEHVVRVAKVSEQFFPVLGLPASAGQLRIDDGEQPSAVISFTIAEQHGVPSDLVGRTLSIGDRTFLIAGVAPRHFRGLQVGRECDLWLPLPQGGAARGDRRLSLIARLPPGADRERADADLQRLSEALATQYPATNRGNFLDPTAARRISLRPYSHLDPAANTQAILLGVVIGGASLLLLLSACLNVGGLLLSWSVARRRELAVKMALGATRQRLIRQLLLETLCLSVAGGAVGVLFAWWTSRILPALFMTEQAAMLDTSINVSTIVLTVGVACLAGALFAIAPVAHGTAASAVVALRADAGGVSSQGGGRRLRSMLVTAQVALSTLLLLVTSLLMVGLDRALEGDLASTVKRIAVFTVDLPGYFGDSLKGIAYREALLARVLQSGGVAQVSWASRLPLGRGTAVPFRLEGRTADVTDSRDFDTNVVSPGFFDVLSLRRLEGRLFDGRDVALSPPVVVVDELLARRYFGKNAVGAHLIDARGTRLEIVGVVQTGRYRTLQQTPQPTVYYPVSQDYLWRGFVIARTVSDPTPMLDDLRRVSDSGDDRIKRVATLATLTSESLALDRLTTTLVGACGLIALVMSTMGVYGIMIDAVHRRTREIGLRVALGAAPLRIAWLVLMEAAYPATVGLMIGGVAAVVVGWLARVFIYGVPPVDVSAVTIVAAALVGIVALAAVVPLRRALRVHPNIALRAE